MPQVQQPARFLGSLKNRILFFNLSCILSERISGRGLRWYTYIFSKRIKIKIAEPRCPYIDFDGHTWGHLGPGDPFPLAVDFACVSALLRRREASEAVRVAGIFVVCCFGFVCSPHSLFKFFFFFWFLLECF